MKTVNVPPPFESVFERAQEYVERYFGRFQQSPERGTIDISGQRYLLVRAGSMSVEFFDVVQRLYGAEGEGEAHSVARSLLFDIAHSMGLADAEVFARRMNVSDPISKLSAGPIHFAHAGWAFVDVSSESHPTPDEDYLLIYDHPYSFESDAWLKASRTSKGPVCVMNAGYSSGWCEASFGVSLVASEITCRAKGDEHCRFIMAPPNRIQARIREYLDRHRKLERQATHYEIPGFFARKQAEKKLREQTAETQLKLSATEELKSRIIEALPGGLAHVGADGAILEANAEACRILGLSYDELTRRYTTDFETETVWEDGTPARVADYPVTRALLTGRPQPPCTIGVKKTDGTIAWAVYTAVPVRAPDGDQTTGAIMTFLDITERKREEEHRKMLDEKFRETQRLESLGVLAGGIAHDFNNLLVGMLTSASLARSIAGEASEVGALLGQVERSAQRAAELTEQLLAYAGRTRSHVETVDLSAVVRDMAELLSISVSKDVSVEFHFADQLLPVEGDTAQLRQVAMNLILNAAESIDGTGSVVISTSRVRRSSTDDQWVVGRTTDGDYCELEVRDTGSGMDSQTLGKVFDPFFTTKFSGRGLGLAAVGGIVRSHEGAIAIDSTSGRGTIFRVVFPRSRAQPTRSSSVPAAGGSPFQDKYVLVIDDDDAVRNVVATVLHHHGCRVLAAAGGPEGLDVYARHHRELDLVLLDLTMPGMDGGKVFARLRATPSHVPVVIMSGFREEELASRFTDEAPPTFLAKPFKADELMRALSRALNAFTPS